MKPSMCTAYFDRDNLYGWAMIQYLLIGGFGSLTNDETHSKDSQDD